MEKTYPFDILPTDRGIFGSIFGEMQEKEWHGRTLLYAPVQYGSNRYAIAIGFRVGPKDPNESPGMRIQVYRIADHLRSAIERFISEDLGVDKVEFTIQ